VRSELVKQFFVESAHVNAHGDDKTSRIHGHSYRIDVVVEGEVSPAAGWVVDFGDIKKAFRPLYETMDHHSLEGIVDLPDTTLGGVRKWLSGKLRAAVPSLRDVRVRIMGDCAYRPCVLDADPWQELPVRVGFSFEAAHHLPMTPEGHKCHRLHGHSYRVEVAAAQIDPLLESLHDVYCRLDHRCLNDVPGLENATSEILSQWIWNRIAPAAPNMRAVIVQETCTARCAYFGT